MLRRVLSRRPALRDESGFTLVEMLVVAMTGVVIVGALFTILDVTLHQTTRTFTKVSATQAARTAFETIENQMHSACVAAGTTPVQGSGTGTGNQVSDDNNLVYVSYFGTAASPTPTEHKISFINNTLTDTQYTVTGTNPSTWTFSTTPTTTVTLLPNVSSAVNPSTGSPIPVFQYFAYEPYTDGSGNTAMMLMDGTSAVPLTGAVPPADPLPTTGGLSANDASQAAEVVITLKVGADSKTGEIGSELTKVANAPTTTISDSIVLRFVTTPNQAGSNATFGPCS